MSKTLEILAKEQGFLDVKKMMEREVANLSNLQLRNQKMALMERLNTLFNGEFLTNFTDCTYGNFLSRALTAYVISNDFDIPENESTNYVTDDTHDFGIDGLYFYKNTIYIYQTKFSNSILRDSINPVKEGIKMLFSYRENLQHFNKHFLQHEKNIIDYMNKEDLKVVLKIVFFGEQISSDVKSFLEQEIKNNKGFGDFIDKYQIYKKSDLLDFEISSHPIDYCILLDNYFERDIPLKMYAGCIKVSTLRHLFKQYGNRLFNKNIRYLIKDSSINMAIQETLKNEPENFIYYNNGITITCDKIVLLPNSSTSETLRNLKLYNLNIVNGAQTVISASQLDEEINDNALIQIRIIQTQNTNNNFLIADNITKYNNSQNAVYIKDLRILDPIHKEIRREFIKWGYYYKCKTGEECISNKDIDFEDLFIALACYHNYSYIAKINKGRIWETNLYNELLKIKNYELFLKLAIIKKKIEQCTDSIEKTDKEISHWDRLILEIYYKQHPENIVLSLAEIENVECSESIHCIYTQIKKYIQDNPRFYRTKSTYSDIILTVLQKKIAIREEKQLNLF